jgi:hypothetical protein
MDLSFTYKGTLDIMLIDSQDEPVFPSDVETKSVNSWTSITWHFANPFRLSSVLVEAAGTVYLGGLHFLPTVAPEVQISELAAHTSWSKLTLESDTDWTAVELTWQVVGSVEAVRHYDIYYDSSWLGRAYGPRWFHKGLQNRNTASSFQVVAESWWGTRLSGAVLRLESLTSSLS